MTIHYMFLDGPHIENGRPLDILNIWKGNPMVSPSIRFVLSRILLIPLLDTFCIYISKKLGKHIFCQCTFHPHIPRDTHPIQDDFNLCPKDIKEEPKFHSNCTQSSQNRLFWMFFFFPFAVCLSFSFNSIEIHFICLFVRK